MLDSVKTLSIVLIVISRQGGKCLGVYTKQEVNAVNSAPASWGRLAESESAKFISNLVDEMVSRPTRRVVWSIRSTLPATRRSPSRARG
jgi:hypothetical protein